MNSLRIDIKGIARKIYYFLFNDKVIAVKGDHMGAGKKWIIDRKFGMAYYKGYYEPRLTRFINDFLDSSSIFLDVGAHAGYFSLIAGSKAVQGYVYSFEPEPSNFAYIQNIRNLNKMNNWIVEDMALSDKPGNLGFQQGTFSSMGKISTTGKRSVAATSVDYYFTKNNIKRLDLIKIDVEGYGGNVLKGGVDTILKFKPYILMEVHKESDEYLEAYKLFNPYYEFIDFDTLKPVIIEENKHMDYLLLMPKNAPDHNLVLSILKTSCYIK
jgi:FkbM family methyltransferase